MADNSIDSLVIDVKANSTRAINSLDKLSKSLENLYNIMSNSNSATSNFSRLATSLNSLNTYGRRFNSTSRSLSNSFTNVGNGMGKLSKKAFSLASAFGKFYATWFLAIRAIKTLWKGTESAMDYVETYNYFAVTMNKVGNDMANMMGEAGEESAKAYTDSFRTELGKLSSKMTGFTLGSSGELIATNGNSLGLDPEQMMNFQSRVMAVTNSLGLMGTTSVNTAKAMSMLSADISSLTNTSLNTVMTNLSSGLIGQSRALYKYGIDITNATLQTYAYANGIEKSLTEMTQAEKMQLRVLAILDQSKVAHGDMANTINSVANQYRLFQQQLKNLGRILGNLFLPIVQVALPVINGLVIALQRLFSVLGVKLFGDNWLSSLNDGISGIGGATDDFDGLTDSIEDTEDAVKSLKKQVRGWDELNNISSESGDSKGVRGAIDLSSQIGKAVAEYEKVWEEAFSSMENKAIVFADKISNVLKPIQLFFTHLLDGEYYKAGKDISNIVKAINDTFTKALKKVNWKQVGINIGNFLKGINWTEIITSLAELVATAFQSMFEVAIGMIKTAPIESALILSFALTPLVSNIVSAINAMIPTITNFINSISGLGSTVSGLVEAVAPIGSAIALLAVFVVGLADALTRSEEIQASLTNVWEQFKTDIEEIKEVFVGEIFPELQSGFGLLAEKIAPIVTLVRDAFGDIWTEVIIPNMEKLTLDVLPNLTKLFENLWKNVLKPLAILIGSALSPIIDTFTYLLSYLWTDVLVPLAQFVNQVFLESIDTIIVVFSTLTKVVKFSIDTFTYLLNDVFYPITNFVQNTLKTVFSSVFEKLGNLISGFKNILVGLMQFIRGAFTSDWEVAWEGIKNIFNGAMEALDPRPALNLIIGMIETFANGIVDAANVIIDALNEIGNVKTPFGSINISIPNASHITLPRFMEGGFVDSASIFMAGENGIPELMGTIGGRTAVASGTEITGISDTIRETSDMEIELLRQQNALLTQILAKEGLTTGQLFNAVRSENNDFKRRNGVSALA